MHKPLSNEKIAILVANGFCEQDMTSAQRALLSQGANVRIVSMDNSLVNSWNGTDWGLHFAADAALNSALAVDYSMLVIPGGRRSVEKLKLTAHTKRFINGFMNMDKPVAAFGEALDLLVMSEKISGMRVTGSDDAVGAAKAAEAVWVSEPVVIDGALFTANPSDDQRDAMIDAMTQHFMENVGGAMDIDQAA